MPFSSNLPARSIAAALLRAEVLTAWCRRSSALVLVCVHLSSGRYDGLK